MAEISSQNSDAEVSDDCLKIVIESPKRKFRKKCKTASSIDPMEKEIIENIEGNLDVKLEEKASKSNLTTCNVKNIIRQVVTNEHVLALVRQSENPDPTAKLPFEPKLTRAKAKELFTSPPVSSLPWSSPVIHSSEVQKLITDDLAEDSSGDEYVPVEEESEDDRDSLNISEGELSLVSPCTPIIDSPTKIQWSEDGIFKIPTVKQKENEEANIALRTRSKLSLSATPLEIIEEAFIPPDITTDMYDMDCDDEVWSDFLKKFTRPLDEITKATEDEDHDPEYNILADEEVDKVDKEELRADKAVKVSRKELNDMLAELFEYSNNYDENQEENTPKIGIQPEMQVNILDSNSLTNTNIDNQNTTEVTANNIDDIKFTTTTVKPISEVIFIDIFRADQILLLEQQIRQYVQILTQNFILSYHHPEFHYISVTCKESLLNFKLLGEIKENSYYKSVNLEKALNLIQYWENQVELDTDEIKSTKAYVCKVLQESKESRAAGVEYIVSFPPFVLETISKSDVFIYPNLLPRIPFKSESIQKAFTIFLKSDDELLALGLEQFIPYLEKDPYHVKPNGEVKLKSVCAMIETYMLPMKSATKIYRHICSYKNSRSLSNPISYYYNNKRAPVTIHYVKTLSEFGVVPPCKRSKELLPYQWKMYLYPEENADASRIQQNVTPIAKVMKPPSFNKNFQKRISKSTTPARKNPGLFKRNLNSSLNRPVNKGPRFCSTPKPNYSEKIKKLEEYFRSPKSYITENNIDESVHCMKFNSSIFKTLKTKINDTNMLPSMPFLDVENIGESTKVLTEKPMILNSQIKDSNNVNNSIVEADSTIVDVECEESNEKDNEEDINALMIASSTIKNLGRKAVSGAEKKKARIRREYNAMLAMLTPEDPTVAQEKAQSYAQAYFDKVREKLDLKDYQQFMEILNDFQENNSNISELYKKMNTIIGKDHKDILEEFLTFLTPAQAKDVGKLVPYYMLSHMSLFLRKLEIYFKEQPAQLRKIYRSLTDLSTCINLNMEKVKNTILPLLKGNNLLTDWFLQIFPYEPPPESLLKGPWEYIDVKRDFSVQEDIYETVTFPDVEDPYGGQNCICACHQGEDLMFKSRSQHCIPCGMKFLQGRIYIPTSKGLRLANITFNENSNVDHNLRLNCSSIDRKKRRSEISPSKQLTLPEEKGITNDSEDDNECTRKKGRVSRSTKRKKVRIEKFEKSIHPVEEKMKNENELSKVLENNCTNESKEKPVPFISPPVSEEECDKVTTKAVNEDVTEWDCNTSIESVEVRHSPEHSAESESEFCEESSQDNVNTETDDSAEELESLSNSPVHSDNSNSNTFEEIQWTREEDKTILETLQKEGGNEQAFIHIAETLNFRTISQIKERFQTLMTLLQKMTSSVSETSLN